MLAYRDAGLERGRGSPFPWPPAAKAGRGAGQTTGRTAGRIGEPGGDPGGRAGGRARDPVLLADLRRRIAAIERRPVAGHATGGAAAGTPSADTSSGGPAAVRLGLAGLDRALPWGGLPRGALHEVAARNIGGCEVPAATGFCAFLLSRLVAPESGAAGGPVLWCQRESLIHEDGALYGPGLAAFAGLAERLVVVRGRRDSDVLWAMEEGLRCPALAAVVGEVEHLDLTASRRLQLAAEASGVTALVLRPRHDGLTPSAALTRWRVAAAPGRGGVGHGGVGAIAWDVDLWRCRGGGVPRRWCLEGEDETRAVPVAALLADRPAAAERLDGRCAAAG